MRRTYLLAIVLVLAFLVDALQVAHAATSTISTVLASADTYVDSGSPNANFGTAFTAAARGGSPTRRALLRFTLSAIPAGAQISSAVLQLYVSSDGSVVSGNVNAVGGSWAETTVTYATAPAVGSLIASIPSPATALSSVSVNLTSYVIGKSTVNLYITSASTDGVLYYTRERGSSVAPRLIVTWTSASTATPTATRLLAATPTATRLPGATATATRLPAATPTRTATPLPSATATPVAGSLALPLRLAFYFPAFPEAWTAGTLYPNTNYTPSLGFYDSSDPSVISLHIAGMKYGRIQGGIASWDGPASTQDSRFPALLAAAASTGFKWTLYYQAEALGNPSAAAITSDLSYIAAQYARDPGYLRIGGKPVIFVSADPGDGCGMADRWKTANTAGFYVVLKVFSGYATCASQPDNWHQYGPANDYSAQGSHSVTISPGYWKKDQSFVLARDLTRWQQDIRNMIAARPDFQLVATWNGWVDGTQVEPSVELGNYYLDALHNNGIAGADPFVMAAGDIVCASLTPTSGTCQQQSTANLIAQMSPAVVLPLGDNQYEQGALADFKSFYAPSWGAFKTITRPAVGNHEYLTTNAQGYYDYFNGVGQQNGPAGDRDKGYYSFDVGTWHVIALNSSCSQVAGGCGTTSVQYQWLQQDLANHPNKCTLAYYHIPLFSSGGRASPNMKQIYGLLYANNAELVLDGHDHIYERFAPQDANGAADPLRGLREFTVGTGGANHTSIVAIAANSAVRNANTFGVLKLTLHPGSYDWQFLPAPGSGTFTDSGSSPCH